jgi:hypothetical protein
MTTPRLSRRELFKLAAAGFAAYSSSGWIEHLAADTAQHPQRKKSVILLWMNGGPSQTDTFDMKPGHANGGEFKEIQTSAPGLKICEHLPTVAKFGDKMVPVRSMSTKEGDHGRATFLMRTGYLPQGPIQFPTFGSLISKELGDSSAALPNFVSIAPYRQFSPAAFNSGFLGPAFAPLVVGDALQQFQPQGQQYNENALKVQDLDLPGDVDPKHADARIDILKDMETEFVRTRPGVPAKSHATAYDRAVRLMKTAAGKAFNLEEEKTEVRDKYGKNLFGQGCLLARRLVERGVPFVEVTLGGINGGGFGWDTHNDNFTQVKNLCGVLDPAWGMLMSDLKDRGLLDSTLIIWMGEFGRTPKINGQKGRDHYPNAWATVLVGGGIKGGQAVGKTDKSGETVAERPVSVADLLATVAAAVGIDPTKQNMSNVGRPIRIADPGAKVIKEVLP